MILIFDIPFPFVKVDYGGRGEQIFVDVLHVSMIDQNLRFKSLLTDSCNSNELFIYYRRFEDIDWISVSLKAHAKSQDIPNIDPCEQYEIRIATGPSEITQKTQELFKFGPYYENDQLDLGRVKLQDSKRYLEEHPFDYDVSMNGFRLICGLSGYKYGNENCPGEKWRELL